MITFLIVILSSVVWAAPDCTLFAGRACLVLPSHKTPAHLHLYHRGHYKGGSDFPPAQRTQVARATLVNPDYKLTEISDLGNAVVVATGSSAVSFTLDDIAAIEKKYHLKFLQITLSSHSGGYVGLNLTLRAFWPIRESIRPILMLDNFYSTRPDGLLPILKKYDEEKIPCVGFMTKVNQERVKKHYSFCEVEGPGGQDHETSIGPFLERHL